MSVSFVAVRAVQLRVRQCGCAFSVNTLETTIFTKSKSVVTSRVLRPNAGMPGHGHVWWYTYGMETAEKVTSSCYDNDRIVGLSFQANGRIGNLGAIGLLCDDCPGGLPGVLRISTWPTRAL